MSQNSKKVYLISLQCTGIAPINVVASTKEQLLNIIDEHPNFTIIISQVDYYGDSEDVVE